MLRVLGGWNEGTAPEARGGVGYTGVVCFLPQCVDRRTAAGVSWASSYLANGMTVIVSITVKIIRGRKQKETRCKRKQGCMQ